MQTQLNNTTVQQEAWFKNWFDSTYYQKLYQAHNDQEAVAFIDALLGYLQPIPGSRMLDLACGNGRHSKYLAANGFHVTGLDLSPASIRNARQSETPSLRFRQHDMRNHFGTACYDYIFNFFTSFGYFENNDENNLVIGNIADALKPNGKVLFDYLNVPYVEKRLVAVEEKEIDGTVYHINRWSTEAFIYKRISVHRPGLAQPLEYMEKVARFFTGDFERFFDLHGLQTIQFFGDYDLRPYHPEQSRRLIVLAAK